MHQRGEKKNTEVSKALVLISPKSNLSVEMLLAIMANLLNKLIWDISHDKPLIEQHVKCLLPIATFSVVAKM